MKQANSDSYTCSAEGLHTNWRRLPRWRKQLERLLKLRDHLGRTVCQLRAEACEENPNYSLHMADAATDSFDRDLLLGLASFEQEGLYEIDAALKRIEDGTYGICELTGKPIGWGRLEAIPWTRFSLEAENQLERHMYPHIGRLGAVQPAEKERDDASDDFANQERCIDRRFGSVSDLFASQTSGSASKWRRPGRRRVEPFPLSDYRDLTDGRLVLGQSCPVRWR